MDNEEQKQNKTSETPKSSATGIVVSIIVVAIVFGLIALIGSSASSTSSNSTADNTTATAPSGCSNPNLEQQAQTVDYKQLEKDPNSFNGTDAEFTGQVIQIEQNNDQGIIRLAVDQIYGIWNQSDVVYVSYQGNTNAVNGDIVNVYGILTGSQTYTSEANFQITVPSMTGCIIQEASSSPSSAAPAATAPTQPQVQNSTPTPVAAQPAPQTPAGTWHTVLTYSGPDTQDTAPFTMQGSEWRVTYSCSLGSNSDAYSSSSLFQGIINSVSDGSPADIFTNGPCPQSNTSYSYSQTPGQYALQMQSFNATYNIKIEDYY
jgi:hypothetical protein